MSNIQINDVEQWIQYTATSGQTVFTIPYPFFENSDILVWQNGSLLTEGAGAGQYGLAGAGTASGGTMTLVTGATLNDIITIQGDMPIDRTSIYSATISNLTGADLNADFNREVVMMKQLETVQDLLQLQYAPYVEISPDVSVTKDRYLPILAASQIWGKDSGDTQIVAYDIPTSGTFAPGDSTYIIQTADAELPNAQVMGTLASGLVVNTNTTGVQLTRTLTGTTNEIDVTNGTGIAGNPTVGLADNAQMPGNQGISLPRGTSAQRPGVPGSNSYLRFNTDNNEVEYWDGSSWVSLNDDGVQSVSGTANRITVGGTATDPIIDISSSYVGQASITTLGTVTTGTWNADIINPTYGGTGVNNGSSTITVGADFEMSGAYTFTGTLTGATAVTFPTSGTLATTDQIPGFGSTPAAGELLIGNGVDFSLNRLTAGTNITIDDTGTPGEITISASASGSGTVNTGNIGELAYYAATGTTISGYTLNPYAMLVSDSGGIARSTTTMTDGQVVIGMTGDEPRARNLTAGTGVTIANGNNSITISATGSSSGLTWLEESGTSVTAAVNTGYYLTNASVCTVTLPGTCSAGDVIAVEGYGAASGWIIQAAGGQTVIVYDEVTSSGGTVTSSNQYNGIELLCIVANTTWKARWVSQSVTTA